jgi:acylphosphatase
MSRRAAEVVISGRVQGVGYRAWTRDRAQALGLRGWVRNEMDGSVRALIGGDEEALAAMLEALWEGPPAAQVEGVRVEDASMPETGDFEIRFG